MNRALQRGRAQTPGTFTGSIDPASATMVYLVSLDDSNC